MPVGRGQGRGDSAFGDEVKPVAEDTNGVGAGGEEEVEDGTH